MKKELDNSIKSAKSAEIEASKFDDKIKLLNREKDFLVEQHNEDKSILMQKIEALEYENKVMTEKLIKSAKDMINYSQTASANINSFSARASIAEDTPTKVNNNLISNPIGVISETMNKTKIGNIFTSTNGSKVLTLKMMKDMISEIYVSKEEYDKKCADTKLPKETMEQHMYSYLNQKYGLKSLIVEWATSLINGIKLYSVEDSEVCLFGKVKISLFNC